jgi:hypothetical protein
MPKRFTLRSVDVAVSTNRRATIESWVDQLAIDRWTNEGGALFCRGLAYEAATVQRNRGMNDDWHNTAASDSDVAMKKSGQAAPIGAGTRL